MLMPNVSHVPLILKTCLVFQATAHVDFELSFDDMYSYLLHILGRCPVSVHLSTFAHKLDTEVYDLYNAARKAEGCERIHCGLK